MLKTIGVFLIALFCFNAIAEDGVVILDGEGKLFHLDASWGGPSWKPIDPELLKSPEFNRGADVLKTPGALTRIINNGTQVQVDMGRGWTDSSLAQATGAFKYKSAHVDAAGHTWVELGGSASGVNYVNADGRVIIAKNITYAPPITPVFDKIIGNPFGPGFYGLLKTGRVVFVQPPTGRGSFSVTDVADDAKVKEMYLADDKVLLKTMDGKFALLDSDTDTLARGAKPIPLPKNFKAEGQTAVFSSENGAAAQTIRDTTLLQAAGGEDGFGLKPLPPAPPNGKSKLPPGHKIEIREGVAEQIDAQGKIVPKPPSVIQPILASRDDRYAPFLIGIGGPQGVINDRIAIDRHLDRFQEIFGRRKEVERVMDVLVRLKGKNPVLTGDAGVGKSAIAALAAQLIADNQLPDAAEYQRTLKNAIVVKTTPAAISKLAKANDPTSQAAAVEDFVRSLQAAEEKLGRRIILYIDEMHMFSKGQLNALKEVLEASEEKGILFLGATTSSEFQQMIDRDSALRRRFQEVNIREFSIAETRQLLKETVVPLLERIYRGKQGPGKITDEAVDAAIHHAVEYLPHSCRPEGPYKLLQDAMIAAHRKAGENSPTLERSQVGEVVANALNLPFDPSNPKAVLDGAEKIKEQLRETVVDQHRYTDVAVNLMRDAFLSPPDGKRHRVLLVGGPTGAGKTFAGKQLAKAMFGDEKRLLEIDANQYKTGGLSLNALLGSPPGTVDSEYKGELLEFLDGNGQGSSVIVINELDKAPKELMESLMELIDTGKMTRNGRTYYLGRSLIILTTNKGDEHIYPRGEGKALSRAEIEKRLDTITAKQIKGWFMEPNSQALDQTAELFHPSVLARIDDAVPAAPPSYEGALKIVRQGADRMNASIKDNHRYEVKITDDVVKRLVDAVYVPEDGVRDLNRAVERLINDAQSLAHGEAEIKPGEVITIGLKIGKPGEQDEWTITSNTQTRTTTIGAPQPLKIENPLENDDERKKLLTLEDRLGKHVFGQPEAVKIAARSVRNKKANTQSKRPASMLFLGPTGTGKTELGMAIAAEVYGHADRIKTFDMGKVKWEGHLNKIFGSDPGFQGGNKESPFEQFVKKYEKEGAVLLWDEIGNIGGGNTVHANSGGGANTKTELLQIFYEMLDKGYWVAPHGKRYDLSKFTFVFTSNEGQEWFKGQPNDDLRMATWREQNKREKLLKMLEDGGWPPALLGRFEGNITLYKPLVKSERGFISKKLFEKSAAELIAQHGIKSINVDDKFYDAVADSFFSHTMGARSIRAVANGAYTDLITTALLDRYDAEALPHTSFSFSVSDNYAGINRHKGRIPPERVVEIVLTVKDPDGTVRTFKSGNIQGEANEKRLQSNKDIKETAIHEAGHAVVNDPNMTGLVTDFITVFGEGGYAGYARYEDVGKKVSYTRKEAVSTIGYMLAGRMAQEAMGTEPDTGASQDYKMAWSRAQQIVADWALTDKALDLPVNNGKVIITHPKVQKEISKVMREAEAYARQRMQARWPLLRLIAADLIKSGTVDRKRMLELEKVSQDPAYLAKLSKRQTRSPILDEMIVGDAARHERATGAKLKAHRFATKKGEKPLRFKKSLKGKKCPDFLKDVNGSEPAEGEASGEAGVIEG